MDSKERSEDTGLHFRSDMPRADGHGAAVDIQVVSSFLWLPLAGTPVESRGPECESGCQGGERQKTSEVIPLQVQNVDGCGRLVSMEILPLTFFSDGLKLAEHGFMAFQSASAQGVIRCSEGQSFVLSTEEIS